MNCRHDVCVFEESVNYGFRFGVLGEAVVLDVGGDETDPAQESHELVTIFVDIVLVFIDIVSVLEDIVYRCSQLRSFFDYCPSTSPSVSLRCIVMHGDAW